METVKLQAESYLFTNSEGRFRAISFHELSIDECIVFENGRPKYLLDFNRRNKPLIQDIEVKLNAGEELESIVCSLGRFLGKEWTTKSSIEGDKILTSRQEETIELIVLEDLSDHHIDLTFLATDSFDFEVLLNEEGLFRKYLVQDEDGFWGLETAFIDNMKNLKKMLTLLFKTEINLSEIVSNSNKQVFNLTQYKNSCISAEELENNYQEWLELSGRENSMNEYGNLICIIGYIHRNVKMLNLILITEKRKHYV